MDANPLGTLIPCRRVTNHRPHDRVRTLIDKYLTMREGTPKQDIAQQGLPLEEPQHMPKHLQSLKIIVTIGQIRKDEGVLKHEAPETVQLEVLEALFSRFLDALGNRFPRLQKQLNLLS